MNKVLPITTAMATMLLVGCNDTTYDEGIVDEPVAVCTDQMGNRVDDDLCETNNTRSGGGGFVFLYMNSGSYVPAKGQRVTGGSRYAYPGTSYSKPSTISGRGGFGSSARGGGFSSGS